MSVLVFALAQTISSHAVVALGRFYYAQLRSQIRPVARSAVKGVSMRENDANLSSDFFGSRAFVSFFRGFSLKSNLLLSNFMMVASDASYNYHSYWSSFCGYEACVKEFFCECGVFAFISLGAALGTPVAMSMYRIFCIPP